MYLKLLINIYLATIEQSANDKKTSFSFCPLETQEFSKDL